MSIPAHFSREIRAHAPGKFLRLKFSEMKSSAFSSGRLNFANAWIPYLTCNAGIFHKPQVWLSGQRSN